MEDKRKKIFVSQLEEHIGEEIEEMFYVQAADKSLNRHRTQWISVLLCDKTGEISGKIWSEFDINLREDELEDVVLLVKGTIDIFNGVVGISIMEWKVIPETNYSMEDFAVFLEPQQISRVKAEVAKYINNMVGPYRPLLEKIYSTDFLDVLCKIPANYRTFSFNGGCIYHILDVTRIVVEQLDALARTDRNYVDLHSVDRDLAVAGALLTDIGKAVSYSSLPIKRRKKRGLLVGESVNAAIYIELYNRLLDKKERLSNMDELLHIVISAGREGDRVMAPKSIEAILVSEAKRLSIAGDNYFSIFENRKGVFAYSKELDTILYRKERADV